MKRALAAWWLRNRRRVFIAALFCAAMFAIGYFSPKITSPLMCKVYG